MRRLLALLACVLGSGTAFAASTFRASYTAPEGCPSQAEFVAAVEQRLPGWQHTETGAEREVVIVISSRDTGFTGSVSLDPAARPREVEGPRCDSVVRALALVTAVSLDPTAALSSEPTSELAPPPPALPPTTIAPTPPPSLPPPEQPTPAPHEDESSPSFGFGLAGAMLFGPAPSPLFGVEGHVEVGTSKRDFLLRLAGARSFTGSVSVGSGTARFDLTQGELGICHLPVRSRISLLGCVVTDIGSLEAQGESSQALEETKTSTRFWAASGARVGLDFRIAGPLRIASSVGVLIPWRSQTYVFDNPTETLYESSPVALDLRLGLALIFPPGDQE